MVLLISRTCHVVEDILGKEKVPGSNPGVGSISLSSAAEARSYLNTMTIRQKYLTLGAFCAACCRVVSVHHAIEDQQLFRDLKDADESLGPILERLQDVREGIAKVLGEVDGALVAMVEDEQRLDETQSAVDHLSDALLAHLRYEEEQLLEPIGRLAIRV